MDHLAISLFTVYLLHLQTNVNNDESTIEVFPDIKFFLEPTPGIFKTCNCNQLLHYQVVDINIHFWVNFIIITIVHIIIIIVSFYCFYREKCNIYMYMCGCCVWFVCLCIFGIIVIMQNICNLVGRNSVYIFDIFNYYRANINGM